MFTAEYGSPVTIKVSDNDILSSVQLIVFQIDSEGDTTHVAGGGDKYKDGHLVEFQTDPYADGEYLAVVGPGEYPIFYKELPFTLSLSAEATPAE